MNNVNLVEAEKDWDCLADNYDIYSAKIICVERLILLTDVDTLPVLLFNTVSNAKSL